MTSAQKSKVSELQLQGFSIVFKHKDFIAMQKGADSRLVRVDGSQKRAGSGAQMNSKIGGVQSAPKTRPHGVNIGVKGGVQ